jgi:Kef-type K+ transport system membrane component KefB
LIVLNIGLDLGVISSQLFAMMVLMALVTTMATSPILSWLVKEDEDSEETPPPEGPKFAVSLSE